jgi:inhibitor of cysteine peptidase
MIAVLCLLAAVTFGPPPTIVITNASQSVNVKAGDDLTLALPSNPSTGYHWVSAGVRTESVAPLVLIPRGSSFQAAAHGRPGAGGRTLFRYHAVALGTAVITFAYQGPGASHASSRSAVVTVTVGR